MLAVCLGRPNLGDMTCCLGPTAHHIDSDPLEQLARKTKVFIVLLMPAVNLPCG